jgi:hypothetical protein
MADLLVLLLVLGFFGLCVAFVQGCDRIIGPDDDADLDAPTTPAGDADEPLVTT